MNVSDACLTKTVSLEALLDSALEHYCLTRAGEVGTNGFSLKPEACVFGAFFLEITCAVGISVYDGIHRTFPPSDIVCEGIVKLMRHAGYSDLWANNGMFFYDNLNRRVSEIMHLNDDGHFDQAVLRLRELIQELAPDIRFAKKMPMSAFAVPREKSLVPLPLAA